MFAAYLLVHDLVIWWQVGYSQADYMFPLYRYGYRLTEAEELVSVSSFLRHVELTSLTAANNRKTSSSLSIFLSVLLESFTAKRAINVQTTSARSTQETMLMMVPWLRGEVTPRR